MPLQTDAIVEQQGCAELLAAAIDVINSATPSKTYSGTWDVPTRAIEQLMAAVRKVQP